MNVIPPDSRRQSYGTTIRRPSILQRLKSSSHRDANDTADPNHPRAPPGTPTEVEPEKPDDISNTEHRHHLSSAISIRLANQGSVARDHLASERTFLAYVRTSLAVASAGVALVQFLKVDNSTKPFGVPVGAVTIGLALLILVSGSLRYFSVQRSLPRGYFPVNRIGVALISFVLGSLVVATFGIILSNRIRTAL